MVEMHINHFQNTVLKVINVHYVKIFYNILFWKQYIIKNFYVWTTPHKNRKTEQKHKLMFNVTITCVHPCGTQCQSDSLWHVFYKSWI